SKYVRSAAPFALAMLAVACSPGTPRIDSAAEASAALKQYCADCHNDAEFSGEMSVQRLNAAAVQEDPEVWEHIVRKLRPRRMPPQDGPRPDDATYESLATWLESALDAAAPQTPGAPALRRLNRAEYANAIRDLLELDLEADVNSLLPPDDSAFGFDNIG